MLLFVGLGNPGPQHQMNRHNIGFMALDLIHRYHKFPEWSRKFNGFISEGMFNGDKVILFKPQRFMNASGPPVREVVNFFKVPMDRVFVFHDELDLAPGKVRVKKGGGAAGHNGLRSIDEQLGPDYWRVRLGIGHPGDKEWVSQHVLGDFFKKEGEWLSPLLSSVAFNATRLAMGEHDVFMTRVAEDVPTDKNATIN